MREMRCVWRNECFIELFRVRFRILLSPSFVGIGTDEEMEITHRSSRINFDSYL